MHFMGLGMYEMLIIFALFVLMFGGAKFKEIGKGLGETIREFRKAGRELRDAEKEVSKDV